MKQKYQPINCNFYDELEVLALYQKVCVIQYWESPTKQQTITDTIIDFQIKDQAEYMLLKSGKTIRLDTLISVDGKVLKGYC